MKLILPGSHRASRHGAWTVADNQLMAHDEPFAERIQDALAGRSALTERKMCGGITFMIGGNMACGVMNDDLMIRLDAEEAERALAEEHVRPMDFTGRPLKGFLYISPAGTESDEALAGWVELAADHAASLPTK